MSFSTLDHTADAALRIAARTLGGLVSSSVAGLVSLLGEAPGQSPRRTVAFSMTRQTAEELVVDLCNELLFAWEVERWLPLKARCRVRGKGPFHLRASVDFAQVGPQFSPESVIKAATYGRMRIEQDETGRFVTTMIFDM